jgi:protein involved in polysaccharide export with SLBB domain
MRRKNGFAKQAVVWGVLLFLPACVKPVKPAESQSGSWSVNRGPGGGGFFRGLASGDIDGDGRVDLIGGQFNPGGIKIWLAGTDGFKELPCSFPSMGEVRALVTADLNQDGRLDIVSSIWGELQAVQIWYQKGDADWERFTVTKLGKYENIVVEDINNDGYKDIIAANARSEKNGGIQVWLGDKDGSWSREQGPTRAGVFRKVLVVDLNQDGKQDILAASWGHPGGIKLWLGDGGGGWSAASSVSDKGYYRGIAVADFNNDGFVDIAAAPFQKGIELWWGDGGGKWERITRVLDEGSFWDLQAVDINQDDYPDLLASSFSRQGIVLLLPRAKEWLEDKSLPQTGNYYSIVCADFDADGIKDIAASSYGEGVKLWLNKFAEGPGAAVPLAAGEEIEVKDISRRPYSPSVEEESPVPVLANKTFKTVDGVPEYLIGPGDLLEITFWEGLTPQKLEVTVDSRGIVSVPYMDVKVEGLTAKEVADQIVARLSSIVKNPRVNVHIKEYHSKKVTLLGAVRSLSRQPTGPGIYELYGKTSLMDIISRAGGYSEKADLRKIRINRADGRVIHADLYKVISFGDLRENIILDAGDVVFIPEKEEAGLKERQVYIFGEVKNPGAYAFKEGLGVLQLVGMAGGYTDSAVLESTSIIRGDLANPEIVITNLEKLLEKGDLTENVMLEGNDIVYVPRSFIADVHSYFSKLIPALQFFLYPGLYRDYYTTGGGLRLR